MTAFKSEDAIILQSEESTQGTEVTPSGVFSPIEGEIELPDPEYAYEENYWVGGGLTASSKFQGQEQLTDGTIPFKPNQWLEFYLLLGEVTDDGAGTYTITLKEEDYPPSISLGVVVDTFTRVFSGVTAGSGEINVTDDSELALELDIDALDVDPNGTVTEPAGDNFNSDDVFNFNHTSSNLSIFGSQFARLTDLTITINRNTTTDYYVDDTDGAYETTYGRPEITMDATIKVSDDSIYQELKDGQVPFTSNIEFQNSDNRLNIELQDCNIRSAPHGIPEEGAVEVDVEIVATDIEIIFEELA